MNLLQKPQLTKQIIAACFFDSVKDSVQSFAVYPQSL